MQSACSLNIWRLFSLCECSRSCSLCRFIWLFLSAVIFYFPFHMHFLFSYIWLYMYFVCSLWWFTWLFSFYLLLCSFVLYFISSFVGRLFDWRSFWIWDHPVVCNVCWFRFRSGMQFVCSLNVRRLFSSCARQLSFSLRLLVYLLVVSIGCIIVPHLHGSYDWPSFCPLHGSSCSSLFWGCHLLLHGNLVLLSIYWLVHLIISSFWSCSVTLLIQL